MCGLGLVRVFFLYFGGVIAGTCVDILFMSIIRVFKYVNTCSFSHSTCCTGFNFVGFAPPAIHVASFMLAVCILVLHTAVQTTAIFARDGHGIVRLCCLGQSIAGRNAGRDDVLEL